MVHVGFMKFNAARLRANKNRGAFKTLERKREITKKPFNGYTRARERQAIFAEKCCENSHGSRLCVCVGKYRKVSIARMRYLFAGFFMAKFFFVRFGYL